MGYERGIPYGPIEAQRDDVIDHIPRCEGKIGENWQKDKTVELV